MDAFSLVAKNKGLSSYKEDRLLGFAIHVAPISPYLLHVDT